MYPAPDQLLENAKRMLVEHTKVFNEGGNVDMTEFDKNAKALCASLAALHPTEAKKYEGTLQALIEELSVFRNDLIGQKDDLEKQIASINQRNIANTAYSNAMFIALQTAQNEE